MDQLALAANFPVGDALEDLDKGLAIMHRFALLPWWMKTGSLP
jgi:hypothetical protein